jgi:transposase
MAPLSMDLRRRIVDAHQAGEGNYQQIADRFAVSKAVVGKLVRQYQQTGSLESGVHRRGRTRLITGEQEQQLARHVVEHPDATLAERQQALGLPGCLQTTWWACQRLGARFKKVRSRV